MQLSVGTIVGGHYKVIQQLGKGSFGITYLAQDQHLPGQPQRLVKHLQPRDSNPELLENARRLFHKEADVLYRLNHQQIPALLAHFEENGEFYLVQEFIDGEDLSKGELALEQTLGEAEVKQLLADLLRVLAFVHQQGIIHRDIKPQNLIRRQQDGQLFLIDFGAVKEINTLTSKGSGETGFTIAIGTPGYMPCEQMNWQPRLSSDIYAVGMLGIQALTGIPPDKLPRDSMLEVVWRDLVTISPALTNLLNKMVRYHFNERFPSAVEALNALQDLGAANPLSPTPSARPQFRIQRSRK
jgi:eukaryotic-like serine/threonine-protein kinase